MSEVLYRKYRPQKFAEVIGQDTVKIIIQNAIRQERLSHAYLFTGPRGVGKTTVARLLAKAVNCLHLKDGEPDDTCANCTAIREGRFLDLLEIDAASYTGVDNIREVIDHVKFSPSSGKYKVFIIDEVHMLSKAAFNALLKTLEEPPAHAIFVLATTEIQKVPATIISRSQRFDFRRVSQADILKVFALVLKEQKLQVPTEAQVLVAQAAEGSFRDALSILDQLLSTGNKKITLEETEELLGVTRVETSQKFLSLLLAGETKSALEFIRILTFEGRDPIQFTKNFLEYLRLVMFVKMDVEKIADLGLTTEEGQALAEHGQALTGRRLIEFIKAMLEAYREARQSPVPELPLMIQVLAMSEHHNPIVQKPTAEDKSAEVPRKSDRATSLDLGSIVDHWAEVLSRIKEYNHSLLSSLRLGRIVGVEGGVLTLAFPYNFHKETIEARKNRIVVEQVLEDVFEQPVKIKVSLEREAAKPDQSAGGNLVDEALKVLGE